MDKVYQEKTVKVVVIDGTDHVSGRLAAVVAKLLLNGTFVSVVNCMNIVRSGSMSRNLAIWEDWKKKTMRANPRNGQKHHRGPKALFFRTVRGMIPYKKWKGLAAIRRLRVYDGVPPVHFYKELVCVPQAMASLRLKKETAKITLGDLATKIGWNREAIIKDFEVTRKNNEMKLREHEKKIAEVRTKAEDSLKNNKEFAEIVKQIEAIQC